MTRFLAVLPAVLLVAACSSGGGTSAQDASSAAAPKGAAGGQASRFTATQKGPDGSTSDSSTSAGPAHGRPAALQRAVISHGSIEMESRDVARTRDDVLRLLGRWDGQVANEESGSDASGRIRSVSLALRIPSADFETAMEQLSGVAHTLHQEISSQDVTTQVIDTNARLRAKEDSIHRIEQLLAHAKSLGQIIAIETDLGDRQAELDSLKQQHAWLADQTSLSTVQVTITRTPKAHTVAHHREHTGLLAGLSTGLHALGSATVALLTVVGVLAPFALVVGLVGLPVWLLLRRRRASVPAGPADAG